MCLKFLFLLFQDAHLATGYHLIIHKYARYAIGLYYKRIEPSLEYPGSGKATVLFPVAYPSLPEGGRGIKVKTTVKAGVVINVSVAVTQNITVNQSTTVTVSVAPAM